MGKRVIISEKLAKIRRNGLTKGREAKTQREVSLKKPLTLHVHKGAETCYLARGIAVS
jgi:hypothetical protein